MNFHEIETEPSSGLAIWLKAEEERSIESAPTQVGHKSEDKKTIN